jgi:DNA-binding transcriptional LysR family regulator
MTQATGSLAGEEIPPLRETKMPLGVELRHLRYLVAVADAGTFTHAAERMFIAQPTLSQQIRRLEEMVGTPLLHRHREGLRLTAAGSVLLEESRTVLSLLEHGVDRTRQAAGLGRPRLRIAIPPGLPETLAAAIASRLRDTATRADVDITWLETSLDPEFSLIRRHQASAGLGWLSPADEALPAPLDVMHLGDFEPEAWIPAAHPAAKRGVISLAELALLTVVHGPRHHRPGIHDTWRAILRSASPRFDFTDPPFQQSLPTLAFAASARQPTAVLTGPRRPALLDAPDEDTITRAYDMALVRLADAPLAARAALVWSTDLPRHLQQVLFDAADSLGRGRITV